MTLQIWIIYFFITVVSFIVFYLIKEETKDWKLKTIKTLSACIGCMVGITLIVMTFVIISEHFFPNLGSNSSDSEYECERDPLFGGCN